MSADGGGPFKLRLFPEGGRSTCILHGSVTMQGTTTMPARLVSRCVACAACAAGATCAEPANGVTLLAASAGARGTMAARTEDEEIRSYVERLAAFEADTDAPLDASDLREIASQVGVSTAAIERATAASLRHRDVGARALQRGDLDAAIVALRAALELAPADPIALALLGEALCQRWHGAQDGKLAESERQAARRVLQRSQALAWTPRVDELLAELEGPRQLQAAGSGGTAANTTPTAVAAGPGGTIAQAVQPALSRPAPSGEAVRQRRRAVVVAAVLLALVAGFIAAIAMVQPRPDDADLGALDPPTATEPGEAAPASTIPAQPAPPRPGPAATPPVKSSEVVVPLPWTLDASNLPGLTVDGGGAERRSFRFVPARFRLDLWLRWSGTDALTRLSVSFELLDAKGDVVQAINANVIQDFHPPARPGDLLPVHVQPMFVQEEQQVASARLRVVAAEHAPLAKLETPTEVPLVWVVHAPEGVQLRAVVRAEHRSEFGSSAHRLRSQQVDIELHNEGSATITELQTAQRYLDASGAVVHQGDNDASVPTYLPPLRPGDVRVFRAYESSLSAWSRFELAVQAVKVTPP